MNPIKKEPYRAIKIISGGQTGVDRAALDAALVIGLDCGGWCPKGRKAESGPIPDRYPVQECHSSYYPIRTRLNIQDADATLIIARSRLSRGTALTLSIARSMKRPCMVINLEKPPPYDEVRQWLDDNDIHRLNIAGPRESGQRGIQQQAYHFLLGMLDPEQEQQPTPSKPIYEKMPAVTKVQHQRFQTPWGECMLTLLEGERLIT